MKQNFLTIFHYRGENGGWKPGFQARMVIDPNKSMEMIQQFKRSGVKVIPLDRGKKPPIDIPS